MLHGSNDVLPVSCCGAAFYLEAWKARCAMFLLFKSILTPAPTLRERERAYLAAAVSRYDPERREREVELGLFRAA